MSGMQEEDPELDREILMQENRLLKARLIELETELAEQEKVRQDIEKRMVVNSKTGFPNRYQLKRDLSIFLEEAKNGSREHISVIILKLDRKFDMLVKTLKPSVSEWVLFQTAIRIEESLLKYDRIYHTQDDEFIIVLRRNDPDRDLKKTMREVNDAVIKPHVFAGQHVSIGCTAGISMYPKHGSSRRELLHHADIALEYAARNNKAAQIFNSSIQSEVIEKMDLQTKIIKALESQARKEFERQFELYYQPIVTINGIQGNRIWIDKVDAEVLIRWNHPNKGIVLPEHFIPLAEETGLILPIGSWVLYSALDQLAEWQNTKYSDISLSVNISPKQFCDEFVSRNILEVLGKKKSLAGKISLEITESCLMEDPVANIKKMRVLRENKVQISVDDFGSGYSSLNYLRQLPVNNLKIDKSFIRNLHRSKQDLAITRTIIALGHDLNFNVICEGVEKMDQIKTAYREGCRTFQGFYFGKALPAHEFEALYDRLLESPLELDTEATA
ncbi:MAG: GGDEF domain-containing protein [Spirochaetales bacterium]|nr:GGDEF domain-containing protein [Spirochaetales bacterium]